MNPLELIDALGGTAAAAKLCGIKAPSVSGWKEAGRIPEDKLIRLALVAESRGIATRKQIFPSEWQIIWPELARAATPTPTDTQAIDIDLDRAMSDAAQAGLIERRSVIRRAVDRQQLAVAASAGPGA